MAPLYRGADGPNCKDIINGIAFSMPSCCILLDTAIFLVIYYIWNADDRFILVYYLIWNADDRFCLHV